MKHAPLIAILSLIAAGVPAVAGGAPARRHAAVSRARTQAVALTRFAGTGPRLSSLELGPLPLALDGPEARQTLLVTGRLADGSQVDLSQRAAYSISDARLARVSAAGILSPAGDGTAKVVATYGDRRAVATVSVKHARVARPLNFENEVLPVLTKAGCNGGGCHGKSTGQNGFKLSLLGYDPQFDYNAIVQEGRGRRISLEKPEESLILQKPTGQIPHGGGVRITRDSAEYRLLRRWIAEGVPVGRPEDPRIAGIRVEPAERVMRRGGSRQRLVAMARYTDGSWRDVTREAQYASNDDAVAAVETDGAITTRKNVGDAAIMVRYMGQVACARVTVPLEKRIAPSPPFPRRNFIDNLVLAKLKKLNVVPSALCSDNAFIRRAYVDTIGTLPTADEVRAFAADPDAEKRAKLADRLLDRPERADLWAQRWSDVLRNRTPFGERKVGSWTFYYWIRDAINHNMPYDQFVTALLTAQGDGSSSPPANWYRDAVLVNDTAQLFLGIRLDCAQCHHHPYEKWSQDDYYGLAAFFGRVAQKNLNFGLQAVYVRTSGQVRQPVTGRVMLPKPPNGPEMPVGEYDDPRQKLAAWLTAPDNPFFARAMVNRIWKQYLGRGLVEPVDDMRLTNPPSNPELLDALAREFVRSKYDVRSLARLIMTSGTYQLSATPCGNNTKDTKNYSRAYARRMSAEVLLDAVNQVCGTADRFAALPAGFRAIQLPDETVPSYFLDVFGRPKRATACECERSAEGNLSQTLHIMNSPEIEAKVRDDHGRAALLAASGKPDAEVIEELYLWAFSRPPTERERSVAREYLAARKDPHERRAGIEDLLWTLINTNEFWFNH